jgi:hypothetical protein
MHSVHDVLAVCLNFTTTSKTITLDVAGSCVGKRLLAFHALFQTPQGRAFTRAYKDNKYLIIHIFQQIQHILSVYAQVAVSTQLRQAVKEGQPIPLANYAPANEASFSVIQKVERMIMGSGIEEFAAPPVLWPLFAARTGATLPPAAPPTTHPPTQPRQPSTPAPKRQKLAPESPAGSPAPPSAAELADRKTKGILAYDPAVSGKDDLPYCPVKDKLRNMPQPNRPCLPFMTVGYACADPKCKLLHVSALTKFSSEKKQKEFATFVTKTKGLDWQPGKGPSGTA